MEGITFNTSYANLAVFIDGLKYYPATGKIVGPLPKFLFRLGSNPSVKNAKFQYELSRLIPSIEIKKK